MRIENEVLGDILLSEMYQALRDEYYLISLIQSI